MKCGSCAKPWCLTQGSEEVLGENLESGGVAGGRAFVVCLFTGILRPFFSSCVLCFPVVMTNHILPAVKCCLPISS